MYQATIEPQTENDEGATNVIEALKVISRSQDNVMSTLKALASDLKSNSNALDEVLSVVKTIGSVGVPSTPTCLGKRREEESTHGTNQRSATPVGDRDSNSGFMRQMTSAGNGNKLYDQWPSGIQLREFYSTLCDEDSMDVEDLFDPTFNEHSLRRLSRPMAKKTCVWAVDPNSMVVFLLDLTCAIVLVNDLVVSPYALAWRVDDREVFYIASTIGSCFWLMDFVLNFFIGFYINGELQSSLRRIAMRYIKTWFFMDLIVLTVDWTFIVLQDGEQNAGRGFGKLLRAFKMIKLLRLLRVMKISKILGNSAIAMWTLNMNQSVDQVFRVVKVLGIVLFINHLNTCIWFVIGADAPTDTGKSWIQQPAIDLSAFPGNFDFSPAAQGHTDATMLYQYVAALHQITAHVALASCYVYPNNSVEGIFAVILLIYGLLFGGTLVSFFSTTMTQRALASYERNKQLDALREYIQQRSLRPPLALFIYKAARERLDKSTPLTEDEVPAISLLPHDLYQWVYRETRLQYLLRYPLFLQWFVINGEPLQLLCEKASTFIFRSDGDVVFVAKEVATVAYHIVKGKLTYFKRGARYRPDESSLHAAKNVAPGVWVSEAALWTHWSHVGKLVACEDSSLLGINPLQLLDILSKDVRISVMTTKWAKEFHKRIIAAEPPHAEWPDDLQVPDTDSSDLMSKEMSLGLLRQHWRKGELHVSDEAFAELEEEVISGKCAIQQDGNGHLERLVAVIVVRLERDDGLILAEIGDWKGDCGIAGKVQLPGTKRSAGELQSVATRRVLDSTLQDFEHHMKFKGIERGSFRKESRFGLPTKYSRTIYIAKITERDDSPEPRKAHDVSNSNPVAYILPAPDDGDKLKIFAWLSPQMITHFNEAAEGAEQLNEWVSGLSRPFIYKDI